MIHHLSFRSSFIPLSAFWGASTKNQLMKLVRVTAWYTLHVFFLASITAAGSSYDRYLLSCGSTSSVATTPSKNDLQTWYSDNNSTFSHNYSSTMSATTKPSFDVHQIPYSTARVFSTNFTYSFPVSPGPKFIRLYFYPSTYSTPSHSISATDTYLTVVANSVHVLLHNFSAYLSLIDMDFVVQKEFYVHVNDSRLQLTFSPTWPNSYAFVNGIEVVSVPETLYYNPDSLPDLIGQQSIPFDAGVSSALETAYRLNVGGAEVRSVEDSSIGKMYRQWLHDDDQYITGSFPGAAGLDDTAVIKYTTKTPNYSAPSSVYDSMKWMGNVSDDIRRKANLTWGFEVDVGFYYLVRLHWCEIDTAIQRQSDRVFDVYINDFVADKVVEIFVWVGSLTAVYKDYVVYMRSLDGSENRRLLRLTMRPNTDLPRDNYDILLNGLEIFKINKTDGSLNAPNPSRPPPATPPNDQRPEKSPSHILPTIIGAISGVFILSILLCCLFIFQRRRRSTLAAGSSGTNSNKSKRLLSSGKSVTTKRSGGGSSSLPSHLCRYFSLAEIKLATSDFSDSLIIGHGGFGNVYKGTVNSEDGPITVAIKRLNPLSNQGAREFKMEIELLSKLRHLHLVSLIGYCDASGEMILVYEYMSHGTLRDHLYPHNVNTAAQLPWLQRLEICVGAARGLHYLHTGADRMVIHRDVKSTNILLDERWVAKVSDFGLSKLGPAGGDLVSHVSTAVKGSFGYVDPEYYRRQQLTLKSDVYSFGVVLFEVLCGRAAVNPNLPKEQVNLRIWARRNQLTGTLDTIVDPTLKGQISTECLRKFGDVAESCVRDEGVLRPSMADVIGGLELALQLQLESFVPNSINQPLSWTAMTSGTDQGVRDETSLDEDHHYVTTTNINSPTTDASVGLIRSPEESTWTSVNNSSRLFSSATSEAYGGSTQVFSQIFKADGR